MRIWELTPEEIQGMARVLMEAETTYVEAVEYGMEKGQGRLMGYLKKHSYDTTTGVRAVDSHVWHLIMREFEGGK